MISVYILIGIPGSGKSTWVNSIKTDKTIILSTDNYIETIALDQNSTYSEVFYSAIKPATALLNEQLRELSMMHEKDFNDADRIIIDQTNLSKSSRAKKIKYFTKKFFNIVGVVFETPEYNELCSRLNSRIGKHISSSVIETMKDSMEFPEYSEGFSEIIYADNLG